MEKLERRNIVREDRGKDYKQTYKERVERARIVRRIVFVCVAIISLFIIIGITSVYFYIQSAVQPMDEANTEPIQVEIPIGSSTTQIGRILEEEGLIKNSSFFRYYVRYRNETGFQAGNYELTRAMDMQEIIEALKEGRVLQEPELIFTVPEGLWLENVAEVIAKNTDHEYEEIMSLVNDRDYIEQLIERYPMLSEEVLDENIRYPLEGYLFPARYDFLEKDVSIETIIEAMLDRTQGIVLKLVNEHQDSPYTVHELMTLASIIEREAQKSEDRYLVSSVLYNRLNQGMMLQVDPTVAYAIGEHRYMTTYADLEIDSPYNTYRYAGIPVGPIANPGAESIRAAFEPDETEYLYFYARFNGEVIYTKTYAEHNRVHQQYRHEWVEGQQQGDAN